MKRRTLALILALALCASFLVVPVSAATADPVVYVTIAIKGELQIARAAVTVADSNGDQKYTLDEALRSAHEAYYPQGGSGYASADGGYGIAITKLWGDNSGVCGYYVNNSMPLNLEAEVKNDDEIYTYVYTDADKYSDIYTYFDKSNANITAGQTVSLTLSKLTFNEQWQPSAQALADATITIDGRNTIYKTDAQGKVTVPMTSGGRHCISAVLAGSVLVPPVCTVQVSSAYNSVASMTAAQKALRASSAYSLRTISKPTYSADSDWAMIGLASGDITLPKDYLETYAQAVADKAETVNGVLSSNKYTEYSRVVLGLTAAGYDASDFDGFDLTAPLQDYNNGIKQGVNGAAYALLALNSAADTYNNSKEKDYVGYLLNEQLQDGGWTLQGESADPDVTAITLQALAAYTDQENVATAVDKAVTRLSSLQQSDGGFASYGTANAESCAQVLLAMCELGINVDDTRFVKGNVSVLDAMLNYQRTDGSFNHIKSDKAASSMATYQCQMALVSLLRCNDGLTAIYDMSQAYEPMPFADTVSSAWYYNAVRFAYENKLFNGTAPAAFSPDLTMDRAMLVTVLWRMAGEPTASKSNYFQDTNPNSYYAKAVDWAAETGIATGTSADKFTPNANVSRQEMACFLYRYAELYLQQDVSGNGKLSDYPDGSQVAKWATDAMSWAVAEGLISGDNGYLKPAGSATRAQVATILMRFVQNQWESQT